MFLPEIVKTETTDNSGRRGNSATVKTYVCIDEAEGREGLEDYHMP